MALLHARCCAGPRANLPRREGLERRSHAVRASAGVAAAELQLAVRPRDPRRLREPRAAPLRSRLGLGEEAGGPLDTPSRERRARARAGDDAAALQRALRLVGRAAALPDAAAGGAVGRRGADPRARGSPPSRVRRR